MKDGKKRSKKTTPKQTSKENPTLGYGYPPQLEQSDRTCTNFSLHSFNYPSVQVAGTMSSTTGFLLSGNSNYQVGPCIQPLALPNWQINTAAIPNNVAAMISQQFGRVHSLSQYSSQHSPVSASQPEQFPLQWHSGMSPHKYEIVLLPSKVKKCYGCGSDFREKYRNPQFNLIVKHMDRRLLRRNEQTGQLIFNQDYSNTYYHAVAPHIQHKNPVFYWAYLHCRRTLFSAQPHSKRSARFF